MLYKIDFYVPTTHLAQVKDALFAAGAGKVGLYRHCAWQVLGEGQFLPEEGSQAFIGEINKVEKVMEYKVEMICDAAYLSAAILALKNSHPYETPAYHVIKIEDL